MHDIEQLLQRASSEEFGPAPLEDIVRRSSRRRVVERAVIAGGVAATMAVLAAILAVALPSSDPAPVIDEPPSSERTDPDDAADDRTDAATDDDAGVPAAGATISVAELDAEVFVARADGTGQVVVFSPEGRQRTLALEPAPSSAPRVVPDGLGGFVWQPSEDSEAASILHVDNTGATSILASTTDPQERLALVGNADGALVTSVAGSTPDGTRGELLEVPFDGGEPVLVRDAVTGWEDTIELAAGFEILLQARSVESSSLAVVDPPDGEPVTVFEGGEADGVYIQGVGAAGADIGVVLIEQAAGFPDHPEAHLLLVDLNEAAVIDKVEVPLQLGAEDSWHVPRDVSTHGRWVLINRDAEGTWLAPLVYDLETGDWAVLEGVEGRAALATPMTQEPPAAACAAEDDELQDAPPTDGQTHIYLPCEDVVGPSGPSVFRLDAATVLTGDVEQDAAALLDELLEGPSEQQRDRGYSGAVASTSAVNMQSIALDEGLLTIDFRFLDGEVNNLNTSSASATWHASLRGTLFQLPEIDGIELRLEGSCEDYTAFFQGDGCVRFDRSDAPWASG